MKMKKILQKSCMLITAAALFASCSKFDELGKDPLAASGDQVQVEYFINNAIIGAQMDPHVAERAFVLYWKTAGHQQFSTGISGGGYNDGWSSDYYSYVSGWLNSANTAIQIAEEQTEAGNIKPYTNNLLQVSRIWRAYLMSELSDNFGPIPINAFQGVNPEFSSVKDVYYFILAELKDASSKLDLTVTNPNTLGKFDQAYGFDYSKWQRYANSMRLRLAMRLSEVDEGKAKEEFEDAASKPLITAMDQSFQVQERPGWDPLSGVMTREWNAQFISPTLYNLYMNLGGVDSEDQLGTAFHPSIKPADYIGVRYENHIATKTNNPSAGYWLDGLPNAIDPRAYKAFIIPGDLTNSNFSTFPSWTQDAKNTKRNLMKEDGTVLKEIDAKYTYNASTAGDWGAKGAKNFVRNYEGTIPRLSQRFRSNTEKRIFFAPWETHFLLAEAAVRGWATPIDAKTAYQEGVRQNFEYWGVSNFYGEYIASEDYNRAGTSVSWDHTVEPGDSHTMTYVDGYTGATSTATILYPKNDLYENGTVRNDHLTKIITQKFLAQTPYLPLETWNDHRRLGLPFFENPAVENPIPTLPALTSANYMTSDVKFFPQRLKYPSGLPNSNAAGYEQAVSFLGGPDDVFTPLWWAKNN
jgi:hypothetical protein